MRETKRPLVLPSDRDATGRDLGTAELELLAEVVRSGHLSSTGGTFVPRFERAFALRFGLPHAVACASGSAAIHAAIASLGLADGDEVVTTPITDMGAILPICYERAVPVFADVDPATANVTAATLEACIGPRTRALIVTHLFGMPCAMAKIAALAREHGLVLIEDCAQAFLAEDGGRVCGTFGDLACFSFQQGKHLTTGEGGIVITADAARADLVQRFVNKGWGYGDTRPDHDRPGLNYRLTELQAAVGIAQLAKLDSVVLRRERRAAELTAELAGLDGIAVPEPRAGTRHAFWRYALRVDRARVAGGAEAMGKELARAGIANTPRYIQKPAFECGVFMQRGAFPVVTARSDLARGAFPGVREALDRLLVLPWNEHYTAEHVAAIAAEVVSAHAACTRRSAP